MLVVIGVQAQECDSGLLRIPIGNKSLQYRERGNRCEGFYAKTMEARWEIVGVMLGDFDFVLDEAEIIEVSSPIVTDQPVHVRAVGIPSKTYYRMDAQLEPEETLFWPVADVLNLKQLSANDIGIFGWIRTESKKVYVPVAASSKMTPVQNNKEIRVLSLPAC